MFSTTSNIVVSNLIKFFFVFSIDWISFSVDLGAGGNDSEVFWFSGDNFELNRFEASSDYEQISLFDWSVGIFEVWNKEGFGEVTSDALDGVFEWENVDFGEVRHLSSGFNHDHISESDSEILPDCFVDSNFPFVQFIIDEGNN